MHISFDIETNGLEPYRPGFAIVSGAFAWRRTDGSMGTRFVRGQAEVLAAVEKQIHDCHQFIVHNVGFEWMVFKSLFNLEIPVHADTMRLVQNYDNGDYQIDFTVPREEDEEEYYKGFGLKIAGPRILKEDFNHAEEQAYQWIRDNVTGYRRGREGAHLSELPDDILETYNIADVENTLKLYEHCTKQFAREKFDWTIDHALYLNASRHIALAQIDGLLVLRESLAVYADSISTEVSTIENQFHNRYATEIETLCDKWLTQQRDKRKTERGKAGVPQPEFNVGSNHQLAKLFVDVLGMPVQFTTKTGQASFKKSHLHTWGEGGEVLYKRRQRLIVGTQSKRLLQLSEADGFWHNQLKACGTATGRFAGSGGLNAQGLARNDVGLMSSLVPRLGHCFVSMDAVAGEPTVTSHLSKDPMYRYTAFDGVGQKPHYANNVLMIDDIYLCFASVHPLFWEGVREAFNRDWNGLTFADQWMKDPEVIKEGMKKIRKNAKWMTLGFSYGMGPKKLVIQAYDNGFALSALDARKSYKAFWDLFSVLRAYGEGLSNRLQSKGFLVNPFGYRLTPVPHKGLNYMIQSSLSGVLNWYTELMVDGKLGERFVTLIHDELIVELPIENVEALRQKQREVLVEMNNALKWDVDIRFGFKAGADLYSVK